MCHLGAAPVVGTVDACGAATRTCLTVVAVVNAALGTTCAGLERLTQVPPARRGSLSPSIEPSKIDIFGDCIDGRRTQPHRQQSVCRSTSRRSQGRIVLRGALQGARRVRHCQHNRPLTTPVVNRPLTQRRSQQGGWTTNNRTTLVDKSAAATRATSHIARAASGIPGAVAAAMEQHKTKSAVLGPVEDFRDGGHPLKPTDLHYKLDLDRSELPHYWRTALDVDSSGRLPVLHHKPTASPHHTIMYPNQLTSLQLHRMSHLPARRKPKLKLVLPPPITPRSARLDVRSTLPQKGSTKQIACSVYRNSTSTS